VIRVKREKSTIVAALAALETHGVSELNRDRLNPWARIPNSTPPAVRETIIKLISVPVTFVRSFGRKRDDVARLFFSAHGGAVSDPDQLNDLVVERVHAKRKKLAAANASERHLFVWLSGTYPAAELAFSTLSPPAPPAIPSEVDAVWLAKEGDLNRLWCLRPPRGWEIVRLDPLRHCAPWAGPAGRLELGASRVPRRSRQASRRVGHFPAHSRRPAALKLRSISRTLPSF
jgi:hypothetical protein